MFFFLEMDTHKGNDFHPRNLLNEHRLIQSSLEKVNERFE